MGGALFTCIIKVRAVLENIQAVLFTFLLIYGIIKLIDKHEFVGGLL